MRKTLLLLLLFLPRICNAQVAYDVVTPSANAEQFFNHSMAGNDLCKGQVSLSIPLYELPSKGYSLPISLSFYSGNVTHVTNESPVGLGWSLNAGGVIMMNINGRPDSLINTKSQIPWQYDSTYLDNHLYLNVNNLSALFTEINRDPMPDSYSYSFPSHSGDIYVEHGDIYSGTTTHYSMFPDRSCRFEKNESRGYVITDDLGNKYSFENFENCIADDYTMGSTAYFLSYIDTKDGGHIDFHYANESYTNYDQKQYSFYVTNNTLRLTDIQSEHGKVVFDYEQYLNRKVLSRIKCYEKQSSNDMLIKEFRIQPFFLNANYSQSIAYLPADCKTWYTVKSITEYNAQGQSLPPYEFLYSYNFDFAKNSEGYFDSYGTEDNCPRANDWSGSLPFSYVGVDLTGTFAFRFTNDYQNNTPYIRGYYSEYPISGCSMNGDYFVLSKVKYPGGATEEFLYEDHTYNSINNFDINSTVFMKSGKRLKAKQVSDGLGHIVNTTYTYSNGVLFNPSLYVTTRYVYIDTGTSDSYWKAIPYYSKKPSNANMGQPVYYKTVEEQIRDGNYELENAESGAIIQKKRYTYSDSYTMPPTNYLKEKKLCTTIAGISSSFDPTSYDQLAPVLGDNAMAMLNYPLGPLALPDEPMLLTVETFKAGNYLCQKEEYTYDRIESPIKYGYTYENPSNNQSFYPGISRSVHKKNYWMPKQIVSHRYTSPVVHDTIRYSRSYTDNRLHSQLNSSLGQRVVKSFKYADEIRSSGGTSPVINQMKEKNMIGMPIVEATYINDRAVSGKYYSYGLSSGVPNIETIYDYVPTPNATLSDPVIGSNGQISVPSQFRTTATYTYPADSYRPTLVKELGAPLKRIVWGHGDRLPLAVFENYQSNMQNLPAILNLISNLESFKKISSINLEYLELKFDDIMSLFNATDGKLTLYTHDPSCGMTSMCCSDGTRFFYYYDEFGRLKEIRDKNHDTVEGYQYRILEGRTILPSNPHFNSEP